MHCRRVPSTAQPGWCWTNTVYFLGKWAVPFNTNLTFDENFTAAKNNRVKTSMMHKSAARTGYAAFNADGSFFDTPRMRQPIGQRPIEALSQ